MSLQCLMYAQNETCQPEIFQKFTKKDITVNVSCVYMWFACVSALCVYVYVLYCMNSN